MLVLSRQRDESIIIGDNIVITIVDIRGDKVRLGIQAPGDVSVHRTEIYDAIQRENQAHFHKYLDDGEGDSAYGMLIDNTHKAVPGDLEKLSNVMGVSTKAIENSVEYNNTILQKEIRQGKYS